MKKLLILLLLITVSCSAQKTTQAKLYKKVATVSDIIGDRAMLSSGKYTNFNAPADDLEVFKEYVFYLEIVDCEDCPTKRVVILAKCLTTGQIQKDQETNAKKFSNRSVISN